MRIGQLTQAAGVSARSLRQLRRITNLSLSIQHISDRLEIQDILTQYCYAVDDRDWDKYRQLFTPDAVIDDTATGGIKSGARNTLPT